MDRKYVRLARDFGVVGAGGAGFPTHIKLNTTVDYLIINGAECEPLMTVDQLLMEKYADLLCYTINELRAELGAREAFVGIKAKHAETIRIFNKALHEYPSVKVVGLGDFYPAGDEVVLIYETTLRQVPQGGIPLDCGVVVINIETVYNLYQAGLGRPVTHKWVTVAGNVAVPGVYRVPLGVTAAQMIRLAGGATIDEFAIINGGPMMGKLVDSLDAPVTKTTKGLLVLPNDSPVVVNLLRPIPDIVKQAQSICCQCRLCTDLCPRNLLGYEINPSKTILSAGYSFMVEGSEAGKGALLCSECGACDMYACPMGLSPRRVNQVLKAGLSKNRIAPPNKGKEVTVDKWRPYRRIPSGRLVLRLGLYGYSAPVTLHENTIDPDLIIVPLLQGIGVPSQPVVQAGDPAAAGDLIARIPDGKPASNMFSGISGVVSEVTPEKIIIQKRKGV